MRRTIHPQIGLHVVNSENPDSSPDSSNNPHRPLGRGMAWIASLLILGMFYLAMSLLTVDPVLFPVRRAERRVA